MTMLKIEVNPLYLKRKKLELVRDIELWENAEEDSEEEKRLENKIAYNYGRLIEWEKKWKDYTMVQELKFWLKEDLKEGK